MEVKKQEEEDEGADTQGEGKGKMGKGQSDVKTEEKPEVRLSNVNLLTLDGMKICISGSKL